MYIAFYKRAPTERTHVSSRFCNLQNRDVGILFVCCLLQLQLHIYKFELTLIKSANLYSTPNAVCAVWQPASTQCSKACPSSSQTVCQVAKENLKNYCSITQCRSFAADAASPRAPTSLPPDSGSWRSAAPAVSATPSTALLVPVVAVVAVRSQPSKRARKQARLPGCQANSNLSRAQALRARK